VAGQTLGLRLRELPPPQHPPDDTNANHVKRALREIGKMRIEEASNDALNDDDRSQQRQPVASAKKPEM